MSIESVMPSNHLLLCCPLLILPSIFPSIRVFSNESALRMRWPKYWSYSFNITPSNEHPDWSPLGWTGWISLQSKELSRVFSNTTVQKHQFFCTQFSLYYSDAGRDWGQEEKGTTEDEMAGWHHWLDGCESQWTPGVVDGQGGLACCDSWGHKESDTTEWLNWSDLILLACEMSAIVW